MVVHRDDSGPLGLNWRHIDRGSHLLSSRRHRAPVRRCGGRTLGAGASGNPAPGGPVPGTSLLPRVNRLAALGPEDTVAGLLRLAMNFPAVCDAMLDKTEFEAVDDPEDFPCGESWPYCTPRGAAEGIFSAYGGSWRHYRWDYALGSKPEVFDAKHDSGSAGAEPRPESAAAF